MRESSAVQNSTDDQQGASLECKSHVAVEFTIVDGFRRCVGVLPIATVWQGRRGSYTPALPLSCVGQLDAIGVRVSDEARD